MWIYHTMTPGVQSLGLGGLGSPTGSSSDQQSEGCGLPANVVCITVLTGNRLG